MKEWQQTRSGRKVYPLAFTDEMLDWGDVGHALGNICRYTGHTSGFYSVAEHCCHVSDLLVDELKLAGLVHDAAEAYITDLPAPIKHLELLMPYVAAELRIEKVMADRLGLQFPWRPEVKTADMVVYAAEVRELMQPKHPDWVVPADWLLSISARIGCWSPERASKEWKWRFNQLYQKEESHGKLLRFARRRGQEREGGARHGVVGGV